MDALIPAFLAALFGEFGDKTQLLLIALAARSPRPRTLLGAIALAAAANALIAGFGGAALGELMNHRAATLLLGLSLLLAGAGGLRPAKAPQPPKSPAFWVPVLILFVVEFGDRTMFVTAALAARSHAPLLAAAGCWAGIVAASVPALLLVGEPTLAPALKWGRRIATAGFLLFGLVTTIAALRLI